VGYPAGEADRCRVAAALAALSNTAEPSHSTAIDWIRAESAAGIVRKVVIAAGEGLAGINMGNVEDWEPLMLTHGGAGTSPWQGMIDRNLLTRAFKSYRPSFYALKQIAAVISSYRQVSRVDMKDPHLYAYRFDVQDGRATMVAWADNGLWLPGDAVPVRQASVPVPWAGPVRAEWAVTQGAAASRQTLSPRAGTLSLPLGPIPVFLTG
jgi:hypothetical protein